MFKAINGSKAYFTSIAVGVATIAMPMTASASFFWDVDEPEAAPLTPSTGTASTASAEVKADYVRDVPLAVALRQILPEGYGYALAEGVDLDVLVSWQKGQPWELALAEALQPHGYIGTDQGSIVLIQKADGTKSIPAALPGAAETAAENTVKVPEQMAEDAADAGMAEGATPAVVKKAATVIGGPETFETWNGPRGALLSELLENWSHRANVELKWESDYDYPLEASVAYEGEYVDAVRMVLDGFANATPRPVGRLYRSPDRGNQVLVISASGNEYRD